MKPIKIIITDPYQLFREGIQALISIGSDIECIGETENSNSLLNKLTKQTSDVILIGPNVTDVINTVKLISKDFSESEIIILSVSKDPHFIYKCKSLGICSYLPGEVGKD